MNYKIDEFSEADTRMYHFSGTIFLQRCVRDTAWQFLNVHRKPVSENEDADWIGNNNFRHQYGGDDERHQYAEFACDDMALVQENIICAPFAHVRDALAELLSDMPLHCTRAYLNPITRESYRR